MKKIAYTFLHSRQAFAIILSENSQKNAATWCSGGKVLGGMLKLSAVAAGSLMVCEIYHFFEHSGIYLGDGLIVELSGTGLVRAISVERFLQGRSGQHLLVACDASGRVFANPAVAQHASQLIYSYQPYDLLHNNCHRFCCSCITGRANTVTSFFDLKAELTEHWRTEIHWQQVVH
jgi:hypothetical protein